MSILDGVLDILNSLSADASLLDDHLLISGSLALLDQFQEEAGLIQDQGVKVVEFFHDLQDGEVFNHSRVDWNLVLQELLQIRHAEKDVKDLGLLIGLVDS